MTDPSPAILCFGEVLWDCLPQGLFPGGAPVNVAYHLRQLGCHSLPVTAVGQDFLGEELLRRFQRWGLNHQGVAIIPDKRTGVVLVELDHEGIPRYHILEDMAWDRIEITPAIQSLAPRAAALVYGSLALRAATNRQTRQTLSQHASQALQIFDVNLRPPFDDLTLVRDLAQTAHFIKLNREELAQLLNLPPCNLNLESAARLLAQQSRCPRICVTDGARGAGLLWDEAWSWEPARPVQVKDTIGAGDSFLAGFLHAWLAAELPPGSCLQRACRLSEFVASSAGATPAYQISPQGLITPA